MVIPGITPWGSVGGKSRAGLDLLAEEIRRGKQDRILSMVPAPSQIATQAFEIRRRCEDLLDHELIRKDHRILVFTTGTDVWIVAPKSGIVQPRTITQTSLTGFPVSQQATAYDDLSGFQRHE